MSDRIAIIETSLGPFGLAAISTASQLGLRPIFVTADLDRYLTGPQARVLLEATTVVAADTTAATSVHQGLAPYRAELGGVFTLTDYATTVTAEVAAAAGLPGVAPRAATTARDKSATHRACAAAGVPVASQHLVLDQHSFEAIEDELSYPCIVKPRAEAGSIGVVLCQDAASTRAAIAALAPGRHDYRGQPRAAGCLVESYLVGLEVSVEIVVGATGPTVLGVTDKLLGPHPHFVEIGEVFPSGLPDHVTAAAVDCAVAAVHAIGHDFGPVHVELKLTGSGPTVIEVNGRLPGTPITELVSRALGVDLLAEALALHMGGSPRHAWPPARGAAASRDLLPPGRGRVTAVHGLAQAYAVEGIEAVNCTVGVGDVLSAARDNTEVIGNVRAVGATPYEAARRAEAALGQISIVVR